MANNEKLIDEIKSKIISEYGEEIERNREGEIRFFVRNTEVQRAFPSEELVYVKKKIISPAKQGMDPKTKNYCLALVENCLLKMQPIHYGYVNIGYALNQERTDFDDFRVKVEHEVHYTTSRR